MDSSKARVTVTASTGEALVLTVDGVLDTASSCAAGACLREAVNALTPRSLVVVDLTPVAFFAAAGVHLLTETARVCARRGLRMRVVVAPGTVVARVIQIATVDDLPTYPTLTAALHD